MSRAAAPKGRCSVECRGYFVRPSVRPYVRTSVRPYVRPSVPPPAQASRPRPRPLGPGPGPSAQAPRPRPTGPGPLAQAQAPWPRPPVPGPPAQASRPRPLAQAPRPRPPGLGLTGPNLVKAGRTDIRTDGRTDKISPAFYRTSPLWGRCPAHNLYNIKNQWSTDNIWSVVTWAGQGYR